MTQRRDRPKELRSLGEGWKRAKRIALEHHTQRIMDKISIMHLEMAAFYIPDYLQPESGGPYTFHTVLPANWAELKKGPSHQRAAEDLQ